MSSSVSPWVRASRAALLALGLIVAVPVGAAAQQGFEPAGGVMVIDWRRALAESQIGRALDGIESEARRAARVELDDLKAALEAEEAELAALKETMPRAEFDIRVRDFDQRVRRARRTAQETSAVLQARFAAAREALEKTATPVLDALMAARGAGLVIDRRSVLRAAPGYDATDALIALLDAERPGAAAAALLPPAPPPPDRSPP